VGVVVRVLVGVLVMRRLTAGAWVAKVKRLVEVSVDDDFDFGGGDSAALHAMSGERGVKAESGGDGLQFLKGDACIDGCAEKHVATDSGETIEVGNAHCDSDGRWPELLIYRRRGIGAKERGFKVSKVSRLQRLRATARGARMGAG
jgi:hypothetical protein